MVRTSKNVSQDDPNKWVCDRCGGAPQYYMVTGAVWKKVARKTDCFLCLSCVESKLKRELTYEDFTDCPVNKGEFGWSPGFWINKRLRMQAEK